MIVKLLLRIHWFQAQIFLLAPLQFQGKNQQKTTVLIKCLDLFQAHTTLGLKRTEQKIFNLKSLTLTVKHIFVK